MWTFHFVISKQWPYYLLCFFKPKNYLHLSMYTKNLSNFPCHDSGSYLMACHCIGWVQFWSSPCLFCGGWSCAGTFFSKYFQFSPVSAISAVLHTHSFIYHWCCSTVFLPVLQFSSVSIIPPILHTRLFICNWYYVILPIDSFIKCLKSEEWAAVCFITFWKHLEDINVELTNSIFYLAVILTPVNFINHPKLLFQALV